VSAEAPGSQRSIRPETAVHGLVRPNHENLDRGAIDHAQRMSALRDERGVLTPRTASDASGGLFIGRAPCLRWIKGLFYIRFMHIVLDSYNLTSAERLLCETALTTAGSIVEAAKLLGITRHALKRRIIKHNIRWSRDGGRISAGASDGGRVAAGAPAVAAVSA
jgi:hypothetical protein